MKFRKGLKRILCVMLSVIMIVSVCPFALAAPKLACGHSKYTVTITAKAPECETYGYTEQRECNVCSYIQKAQYQPATGHNYEMVESSKNEKGVTYKCHNCGDSYVVKHKNWSYVLMEKAPTCIYDGWTADRTCGECGYHQTSEVIPATGHSIEVIASDAVQHEVKCSNCDYKSGISGHSFVLVFDEGFNCYSENATGSRVCSVCGYVGEENVAVEAGTHCNIKTTGKGEYKTNVCMDCNYLTVDPGKCSSCSDKLSKSEYTVKLPTCDAPGFFSYNCTCGNSKVIPLDKTGHYLTKESTITRQPTCYEVGIKSRPCLRCDYSEDVEIRKTTHRFVVLTEGYDATCTEDGLTIAGLCTLCGMLTEQVTIPATGHFTYDYNGEQFCANCNKYLIDVGGEIVDCKCLCHNNNPLAQFVFKFIVFFSKMFKINQACDCGRVHYELEATGQ